MKGGCDCIMRNISDVIEQHLKEIIKMSPTGTIEIQRSELADHFQCVPSQINYVINTRFTISKGYYVESKRGGGGYIRICKLGINPKQIQQQLLNNMGDTVTQREAEDMIERLYNEGLLTEREAVMLTSVLDRDVIRLPLPLRDELRSRILSAMIVVLLRHHSE